MNADSKLIMTIEKLKPEETDLVGNWLVVEGKVIGDITCRRIDILISDYLEKVAGGGWETLYRDPQDNRYWELTYPQGEMHGGGPPRLIHLPSSVAKEKYKIIN
jgi:hypothetical protein